MATKYNKVYRGGVARTTPVTTEVSYTAAGPLLPGTAVALDATDGLKKQPGADGFWYFAGEALHGKISDNLAAVAAATRDSIRCYSPRSGDLFVARAVAGVVIVDDLPLTIDTAGRMKAAVIGTDKVHAYVDNPPSAFATTPTPTTLDQLIPVKIK